MENDLLTSDTWVREEPAIMEAVSEHAEPDRATKVYVARWSRRLPSGLHAVIDYYVYAARLDPAEAAALYAEHMERTGCPVPYPLPELTWKVIAAFDAFASPDDWTVVWEARTWFVLLNETLMGARPMDDARAAQIAAEIAPPGDADWADVAEQSGAPLSCRLHNLT